MDPDTDNDGLIDGIEVFGWEILVVNRGVEITLVVSDPGLPDTDSDGLSDYLEYSSLCDSGSNASNPDTDGDGLDDQFEATGGGGTLQWPLGGGEAYTTSPCAFDTDNDGLEDGEEVIVGKDGFMTHANNSDTDGDGLKDGNEVLYIPRPFQEPTHPLVNDTDFDGMLDGWEMQVQSEEDNTNSHSLWVATSSWNIPNCVPSQTNNCAKSPGGYMWINTLGGFVQQKQFEISEMNLTGFSVPNNPLCDCNGRWALDPSEASAIARLPDAVYDIDNDSLLNGAEAPDKWNTNPVDRDSDGDKLFDGWEVKYSQYAIESGLVDNESLSAYGARGVLDPSMIDSDLDGIEDGEEDPDNDGLNRSGLIKRYCPSYNDTSFSDCNIDPDTPDGAQFYQNLANYTNYEEMQNNTNPVSNDTDGDNWNDGPEVYFQDHDDDGMATGWEYHFDFDPYDAADRMFDTDGDGHVNYCEYKWDTNPRDPTSFPGQGELCDPFSE
jgi:heat shock protein beta